MSRLLLTFACLAGLFGSIGCASKTAEVPLQTVPHVDLQRYMGDWHVIAHIPYFLADGKVAQTDRYALRPDGKIENTFLFRKDNFLAKEEQWHATAEVVDTSTNAKWKVQFFWPLKFEYYIVELDPDYRWAVVGHPSKKYLWILSRERTLDEGTYQAIIQRALQRGFPIGELTKVPQPTD